MNTRQIIGLVLGSGSSRGWAHIGVLEALAEENLPIDFIVGCSVGSYVGALYACGCLESLKEFVLKMDGKKVFSYFDIVLPRSGLLDGTKRLQELFCMHTDAREFSDLNIPVMMVATDLEKGSKVILKSGNILEALRATMSIPGLFSPARVHNRWLVDGGLVDPVPVSVARNMADVVIAVDLNSTLISRKKFLKPRMAAAENRDEPQIKRNEMIKKLADYYATAEKSFKNKIHDLLSRESATPDIIETVTTSINIMQDRITRINLAVSPPDILIQPRLAGLKMLDFDQVAQTIEEGYVAAREKVADIKNLLQSQSIR
jgi:NTE family protein